MKIALTGGAYQAKSLISNAQRCVNLYPEIGSSDAPFPTTHYLTPGLTSFGTAPSVGIVRGLYRTTTGVLYAVVGQTLYSVSSSGNFATIGTLITTANTPVSMVDNGSVMILVDSSAHGYAIELATNSFSEILNVYSGETVFFGATKVDYVDTFFILNRPSTNQWYISLSNVSYQMLIGGIIAGGVIGTSGTGYYPGTTFSTYTNVPLTGGTGTGATADITVTLGAVSAVTVKVGGTGYLPADVLSATLGGQIDTFTLVGGTGYTNGTYLQYPISGGSGTGAVASLTIAGGIITAVSFAGVSQSFGIQYQVGDVLTIPASSIIGNGSGATVTITAITNQGAGFTFIVDAGVNSSAFNPLDIASKAAYADPLQTLAVMHREIWLIGTLTTEVWYNTGAADFTFGIMPGVYIEHGCIAPYSLAKQDLSLYWLSQDLQGNRIVVTGSAYQAVRISTHAIENTIQGYATVTDAIGYTYQQEGHVFYVLQFPSANATWVYDIATKLWHQRSTTDSDGNLNRHLSNCAANAYGFNVVGDYQNTGKLFYFDQNNYTDNEFPIPRIRSFPHVQNEDKRVVYNSLIADLDVGQMSPADTSNPPQISLRWSDDRGNSYGNAVMQSMGAGGQYSKSVKWARLGIARDRVFELSWSGNVKTALNGAYIETTAAET